MKRLFYVFVLATSILINMIFFSRFIYNKFLYQSKAKNNNSPYTELLEDVYAHCPADTTSIVFLGNSITAAFRIDEFYPDLNIKNRGISSNQISDVLRRLPDIVNSKPRKLFLMIGVNDILQGVNKKTIVKNYREVISAIYRGTPHTEVFLQSILPVKREISNYLLSDKNRANELIDEINGIIQEMAIEFDVNYIDLNTSFRMNNELNSAYSWDGIHINVDGYTLWRKLIEKSIVAPSDTN